MNDPHKRHGVNMSREEAPAASAMDITARRSLMWRMAVLLLFGLIYTFGIPPFEAPDEPTHLARAWGLAEGQLILKDHPRDFAAYFISALEARRGDHPIFHHVRKSLAEPIERIPHFSWNTALYSPLAYIIHTLIIKLSLQFGEQGTNVMLILYLCRLTTLILFLAMVYCASRICPQAGWPIFWIAVSPMALSQASVVNLDAVVLGTAAVILALGPGMVRGRLRTTALVMAALFLLAAKPTYAPLVLVPIAAMLGLRAQRWYREAKRMALALGLALTATLIWNITARGAGAFEAMQTFMMRFFNIAIDPGAQLAWVLHHPWRFMEVIGNTLQSQGLELLHQLVGILGWLDNPIPASAALLWGGLALVTILVSRDCRETQATMGWMPLAYLAAAVATCVAICISISMIWGPVAAASVSVQGRYFNPVMLALLLGLSGLNPYPLSPRAKHYTQYALLVGAVLIQSVSLVTVMKRFWQ